METMETMKAILGWFLDMGFFGVIVIWLSVLVYDKLNDKNEGGI